MFRSFSLDSVSHMLEQLEDDELEQEEHWEDSDFTF